jgi:hypothetical protein
MGTCVVCGNSYANSFEVVFGGELFTFDSFECAIHRLAPVCAHCGCRIVGHGIEAEAALFCCAHCARLAGVTGAVDHTSK